MISSNMRSRSSRAVVEPGTMPYDKYSLARLVRITHVEFAYFEFPTHTVILSVDRNLKVKFFSLIC